jgi:hypothetical protein
VKGHPIDPFSFVFGLLFALLGLFFLAGDRSVADIGSRWIWPVTILTLGLLMVLYSAKRIYSGMARSQRPDPTAELEQENEPHEPD